MNKKRSLQDNKQVNKKRSSTKLPPRRPFWNIWQALFLILIMNLIEFPLGWLKTPENLDTLEGLLNFLGVGFGDALLYLLLIAVIFQLLHRPLSELGFTKMRWSYLAAGILTGIFLFVFIGLLGNLLTNILGVPAPQSFAVAVKEVRYFWEFPLLLILGGLVAPLKEEVLFRGIIYPTLRQGYGRGKGILFTGIVFAALHFDIVRFLPLFVGGIVLTWLYEKFSSLWPSILAHGTWNILMALALWLQR